jgi:hypothetical protein
MAIEDIKGYDLMMKKVKAMDLFEKGVSLIEIQLLTGLTYRQLSFALKSAGVDLSSLYAEFQKLYDQGLNDSEIGRKVGVETSTVRIWRNDYGLPSLTMSSADRGKKYDEMFQPYYEQGLTSRQIADATSTNIKIVDSWRRNRGYPIIKDTREDTQSEPVLPVIKTDPVVVQPEIPHSTVSMLQELYYLRGKVRVYEELIDQIQNTSSH